MTRLKHAALAVLMSCGLGLPVLAQSATSAPVPGSAKRPLLIYVRKVDDPIVCGDNGSATTEE